MRGEGEEGALCDLDISADAVPMALVGATFAAVHAELTTSEAFHASSIGEALQLARQGVTATTESCPAA